jgi:hypothetical protein
MLILGVQMIEIAKKHIEAMNGGQKFVSIAEVVLAQIVRLHNLAV